MTTENPFKYFKTSPKIIRLAVMYYVRYPLSFRQVEDILHERGIDISHETVRFWVDRFGSKFAKEIRKKRAGQHSNWQWHLDEVFIKINGERFYLWRAVDHEGEVLECFVTKRRNKAAAKKFLIKAMRNTAHQGLLQRISYHPIALLFVRLELLTDNYVEAGPTTDVKTHTYRFDGESAQCSYLKQQPRSRGLSVIRVKYTTTSITKDIFKTDKLISKNAQLLSRSGSKSALHRFM